MDISDCLVDLSGADAICGRITLAFNDCSGAMAVLATYGSKFLCYEHIADTSIKRTHIHFLVVNPTVGVEGLKKVFRRHYGETIPGGNKFWSIKQSTDPVTNAIYMAKGTLSPKMCIGFSEEVIESCRLQWVIKNSPIDKQAVPQKPKEIDLIIEAYGKLDQKMVTFEQIRAWVFHYYWQRNGELPPANLYKKNAGTLFLRIAEVCPGMCFPAALEEVRERWFA